MSLENTLRNARLMEEAEIRTDIVSLGSRVTLKEMKIGAGSRGNSGIFS
jgi:transcription elongation factor GreA